MNETERLLAELRDIHAPAAGWLPAPGWWLLVLLLVLCVYVFQQRRQRKLARLWHQEAMAELALIRDSVGAMPPADVLSATSRLARRVALVVLPRNQVAPLHGDAWLRQLDELSGKPVFTQGLGRLLLDAPYQKEPELADGDLHSLLDAMSDLLRGAEKTGRHKGKAATAAHTEQPHESASKVSLH